MADEIPILDLAPLREGKPGALEDLGAQLRRAFTEVGFYFVRNGSLEGAPRLDVLHQAGQLLGFGGGFPGLVPELGGEGFVG